MSKYLAGAALVLCFQATVAFAQPSYVSPLNTALGHGAAVSCSACHSGSPSGGNAVLPMAITWSTGANIPLSDSDRDGFNNAQEVNGGATNFNDYTVSPFTLAKAAEGSASANVVVVGGGQVTETAITDIYAQAGIPTLPPGHTIAGNVSPLVNTFPATIFFNQAVNAGDKVYVVDFINKTNTLLTTGVTFNANGSVTISGVTGPANIVVDRATPVVPAAGTPRGGEEEGFEGCLSGKASAPLMMFLVMLSFGFMVKRKKA